MKTCRVCKIEKELKQFYSHPDYKDGHTTICKACQHDQYEAKKHNKPVKRIDWFIFD